MKKTIILVIASLAIASCSTTKSGTSKTIDIVGSGVIHKPVLVDLNVEQEKSSKTIQFKNLITFDNAKNEVVRELLKEKNGDLLVEPTFSSETTNRVTNLTVNGWVANYKNFRQIEEKDLKLLEVKPNLLQKAETYQPTVEKKKKNKGLWVLAGAVILGAVAFGVL